MNMAGPGSAKRAVHSNLRWLFGGPSGSSKKDVRRWWEERRYRYNRDLFIVGAIAWLLVMFAGSAAVKPGVDFEEPILMIVGPFLYAIGANLAYAAGPVFDTLRYRGSPRKRLFKTGYLFSVILTGLPGIWAVAAWISTLITSQKLG